VAVIASMFSHRMLDPSLRSAAAVQRWCGRLLLELSGCQSSRACAAGPYLFIFLLHP
jgi:hypothetical protein